MPVSRPIAVGLLVLGTGTLGCGTSPEPKAEAERPATRRMGTYREDVPERLAAADKAAPEEKDAEEKAAVDGYVKVKVEVELRGVLSCTQEVVLISVDDKHGWVFDFGKGNKKYGWELDFAEGKEMRAKAKALDGQTVLVEGSAVLQYQSHHTEGQGMEDLFEGERKRLYFP